MNELSKFGLFDPEAETVISHRQLPHWFQPGVATFITFHTADSMPRKVVLAWQAELRHWLQQHGFEWPEIETLPDAEQLPPALRTSFQIQRYRIWQWKLDACHGECVLRRRELAQIVMETLQFFDEDRYDLDSAIIMPNHVHLIAQFRAPVTLRKQCTSWLHYSARKINSKLGRRGVFWQSETFDHLIRSEEQFHYLRHYIAENGRKARLPEQDYLYWSRGASECASGRE